MIAAPIGGDRVSARFLSVSELAQRVVVAVVGGVLVCGWPGAAFSMWSKRMCNIN